MRYEPATEADKEYFRDLNHGCYRDVVVRQFGEWDQTLQDRTFEEKWPTNNFRKIFVDEELVGGVWVDQHSDFLQLREIQIHPEFQNKGYGRRVVSEVIERANREHKKLRLRVLHENRARALYERMGFRTIDKTDTQFIMELGSTKMDIRPQYHFKRTDAGFNAWDVRRLIHLSADFPVFKVDPKTVPDVYLNHWYMEEGAIPSPASIVEHFKLVSECDLRFPVILDSNGHVMDGMHRICKALLHSLEEIDAVQFTVDPDPDFIDCVPSELPYED